jgi:putative ABC transport system ATP-binding protein
MLEGPVQHNLTFPFRLKAMRDQAPPSSEKLRTWLDDFLLGDVALEDDAETLSVGQKQRIALIRTLLTGPEMLLCDEPTSALDAKSKEIVEGGLERLTLEQKIGIVLVAHTDFVPERVNPKRVLLQQQVGLKEVSP